TKPRDLKMRTMACAGVAVSGNRQTCSRAADRSRGLEGGPRPEQGVTAMSMELADIPGTSLKISPIALGTWAIGGWMWGGTDEAQSISTIRAALEHGINVIDTAPAYGFGRSEEIVGKAIAEGHLRSRVVIATKTG